MYSSGVRSSFGIVEVDVLTVESRCFGLCDSCPSRSVDVLGFIEF